jgi:putative ABC transport system substrate-binding protein
MRRRKLLTLATGTVVSPAAVRAQRWPPVIGVLGTGHPEDPAIAPNLAMLKRGLTQEGFVDGETVRIEYRWAHDQPDRLPGLAAELIALPVDVIVAEGGTIAAIEAQKATSTIPIVFHAGNAVHDGLVDTLAKPGGNLTGVSLFGNETLTKGVQFLGELLPTGTVVALLSVGRATAGTRREQREWERELKSSNGNWVLVQQRPIDTDSKLEAAYASAAQRKDAAVVLAPLGYVAPMVSLAAKYRVPTVYNQREYVAAGGLLSYGASIPAACVIKGVYAGRILKGAKPGELAVQQASKFELVINLKTAAALGLSVPAALRAAADEVFE